MPESSTNALKVLVVAAEAVPFAKTGGLGDAIGSLCPVLRRRGIDIRILMPRYGQMERDRFHQHPTPIHVPFGVLGECYCAVLEATIDDVPVYAVEYNRYFERPFIYGPPGSAYSDNIERFSFLCHAIMPICQHLEWMPDVIHLHDWHTALASALQSLNTKRTIPTVLTIHNLAYQGWIDTGNAVQTGLNNGQLQELGIVTGQTGNLLRGGILHSSLLTTVSPSYADEILTPEFGEGLNGDLVSRRDDLFGVLNGIDATMWNPESDPHIPARYQANNVSGKRACKAALQRHARFETNPDIPLFCAINRFTYQKGMDLIAEVVPRLHKQSFQLCVLGNGDPDLETMFQQLAATYPKRVCVWLAFDEKLSHWLQAGSDFLLMPSRWEPCGLNQLYAQRYGTIPIVRRTGGLRDTVTEYDFESHTGSGFMFDDPSATELSEAIVRALTFFKLPRPRREKTMRTIMQHDYSWHRSAASYEYLFRRAIARQRERFPSG